MSVFFFICVTRISLLAALGWVGIIGLFQIDYDAFVYMAARQIDRASAAPYFYGLFDGVVVGC